MYKYIIKAYAAFGDLAGINAIQVTVVAPNEDVAIAKAKTIVKRENYTVIAIEDLRGSEIKKEQ